MRLSVESPGADVVLAAHIGLNDQPRSVSFPNTCDASCAVKGSALVCVDVLVSVCVKACACVLVRAFSCVRVCV